MDPQAQIQQRWPEIQQRVAQLRQQFPGVFGSGNFQNALPSIVAKSLGIALPPDYFVNSQGQLQKDASTAKFIAAAALTFAAPVVAAIAAPAGAAGVGLGETGATTGLTPATAAGLSAGSVAGPGAAAITGGSTSMGLWGTVAKYAPELISAGSDLAGAAIGAHAAGKAADQQTAASQHALDLQRELYQQTRNDLAPYAAIGSPALGTLRGLMGYGADPGAVPMPAPPSASPTLAQLNQPGWSAPQQMGPGQNFSQVWQGPGPNPVFQAGSPGAQSQSAYGQMVTLRAPNGATKQVPADQADHYLQLGAQRVS